MAVYTMVIDGFFSHHKQGDPSRQGSRKLFGGKYALKHRLWELNIAVLGLLLASGTAFVITGALKNATGKPRPDLIARCLPLLGSVDPPVFGLSNSTICTQTDNAILKDGFRSFPSGHSSCKSFSTSPSCTAWTDIPPAAFGGLFYLSLYLAGKLHVLDNRGEVWKAFVVLIPTLVAALIAISRIMDARHHPFDVITGSLLGSLMAFCAYRQYFPPISESWRKGRAYPIRSWGTDPSGPTSAKDEREIHRDQGVEPMRNTPRHTDEEENTRSPLATMGAMPGVNPAQNTFHTQTLGPGTMPPATFPSPRGGASPNYNAPPESNSLANPYSTSGPRRDRQHDQDGYWSSSSEDANDDEDGYELRPKYTLTDPGSRGPSELSDVSYAPYRPEGAPATYAPYQAPNVPVSGPLGEHGA